MKGALIEENRVQGKAGPHCMPATAMPPCRVFSRGDPMYRKFVSAACAAALLLAAPISALSQSAPRPAPPAPGAPTFVVVEATDNDPATYARKLELAKRYMKAARLDELMRASMKSTGSIMASQMAAQYPGLSREDSDAIMEAATESTLAMMRKMTEQMIPVIARVYSEEELTKITEFMESPVGQSMLNKTPLISAEVAKLMPDLLPDFMQDMQTRMCKKIDCNSLGGAKAPKPSAS